MAATLSSLHSICKRGDADELLRWVAQHGDTGDLNQPDAETSDTPLCVAAAHGRLEVADLLLRKGAHAGKPGGFNWTPLHYAAMHGREKMIALLLEQSGVALEAINEHRDRPIHLAVARGNVAVVRQLLERRAEVNKGDMDGKRPLHLAVRGNDGHGNLAMVQLLLEHAADVSKRRNDGKTALECASKKCDRVIIQVLQDQQQQQQSQERNEQTHHGAVSSGAKSHHDKIAVPTPIISPESGGVYAEPLMVTLTLKPNPAKPIFNDASAATATTSSISHNNENQANGDQSTQQQCSLPGGIGLFYTLDGTSPCAIALSHRYNNAPFVLHCDNRQSETVKTVKAVAVDSHNRFSAVAESVFTIQASVAAPVIDPEPFDDDNHRGSADGNHDNNDKESSDRRRWLYYGGGGHFPPLLVRMRCATSGAEIRYTVDGTAPNATSPLYVEPINPLLLIPTTAANHNVEDDVLVEIVVQGFASKPGLHDSPVVRRSYRIPRPVLEPPIVIPDNGIHLSPLHVAIAAAVAANSLVNGATIRYTLDGSDPTDMKNPTAMVYNTNTALQLTPQDAAGGPGQPVVLKAVVQKEGCITSAVTQRTWTIEARKLSVFGGGGNGTSRRELLLDAESVRYRGAISVTTSFVPTKSCEEYLYDIAHDVTQEVPQLPLIIADCLTIVEDKLSSAAAADLPTPLSHDQLLAIVIYTYDLFAMAADISENFYFQFTNMLRERDPSKLKIWRPYLFFLMDALKTLPPIADPGRIRDDDGNGSGSGSGGGSGMARVYRGTDQIEIVRKNYSKGRKIHWSAFTSSTTDLKEAKKFAKKDGAVFRLHVWSGREITAYSALPEEREILLNPNIEFVVTDDLRYDDMEECYFLEMMEIGKGDTLVW